MILHIQEGLEWCVQSKNSRTVTLRGDYTSQKRIIIYVDDNEIIVRDSWQKIFKDVDFSTVEIAKDMCGMFLRTSFIPPPYTIFANIFLLTVGDYLQIKEEEENSEIKYWSDYPFFNHKSSGKNEVDISKIKNLIKESVDKGIKKAEKGYDNIYLMHSAGKDSNAILYSIHEQFEDRLTCVTYNADIQEREYLITEQICKDLGVKHICVDSDPKEEFACIKDFISQTKSVTGDFALPGYIYTVNKLEGNNNLILDGLGSDIYMGTPLPKINKYFNLFNIPSKLEYFWGFDIGAITNYKLHFVFQSLFMFPAERLFPSIRLSKHEIESLLGLETVQLKQFYRKLSELRQSLKEADWRSFLIRLFETGSSMEKGRLASSMKRNDIYFPFCDREVVDYFFNLPASQKFSSNLNKIPIRNYLKEKTDYNKYVKNKGSFRYDMVSFINANKEEVLNEIGTCSIFNTTQNNIQNIFNNIETRVGSTKIYLMFILASWLNTNNFTFVDKHRLNIR